MRNEALRKELQKITGVQGQFADFLTVLSYKKGQNADKITAKPELAHREVLYRTLREGPIQELIGDLHLPHGILLYSKISHTLLLNRISRPTYTGMATLETVFPWDIKEFTLAGLIVAPRLEGKPLLK